MRPCSLIYTSELDMTYAIFDAGDAHHRDCVEALKYIPGRLLTTWPAVTQALQLLAAARPACDALLELIERGQLLPIELGAAEMPRVRELMAKYADLPMDFADATLVATAERESIRSIFTVDRKDFSIYR